MWCFRRNRSKKELYKAMVNNSVLAEESNQALLAEVQTLKEERSDLDKAQAEETRRLQTEKSALEKDFLDSTALIQHQLDTTLQEKTSLQLSLQEATAELQTAKGEVQDLKEEKQALSTELQSVQQTLKTLEKRSEEERRQKDSIMNDAEHYIEQLKTEMQDQEMHLRKEMEKEMVKCKAQEAETKKLKDQVTQLQMEKSALEKDFLDSTTLVQHQLNTTLQEKTSLQLSLQETTAELQTAKDEVQDLKEACTKYVETNKEVTNLTTILKEKNQALSTELQSLKLTLNKEKQDLSTELQSLKLTLNKEKQDLSTELKSLKLTLNKEKQDLSTELQSVQQTLRTLEKRSEEDMRRKDSIMNDAGLYIDELKTEMQDQEMHLRKEIEEEMIKCKEAKALAVRSLNKAVDENLRLKYEMKNLQKNPSQQQIQDPQEDHAPHFPQKKWRRRPQKTDVYRPNRAPLVTVPKN